MTIDPHTFDDYNGDNEVHDAGELWCSALWDMNWLLINKYGFSSNLAARLHGRRQRRATSWRCSWSWTR